LLLKEINRKVILPTLQGIQSEKMNYKGVIYFGLMLSENGPKLLEYNVRFGDPETEVILPSLKSSLLELTLACLGGLLSTTRIKFYEDHFVDVVLASGGYPGAYEKGKEISGLDQVHKDVLIFHAGTSLKDHMVVTSGGRVLNVVAKGKTLPEAIHAAYDQIKNIRFDKMFYRKDIGCKGLKK
jgi:phosphoribosylamine--glycine ligase